MLRSKCFISLNQKTDGINNQLKTSAAAAEVFLLFSLSLPEGGVVACSSSPCGTDKNENKKTHHNIHALSEAFRGRQYAVMLLICL